ncbi:hypothetical protein SAMN06297164_3150 [Nitrosomonas ureae]|uniref:Uncharacterized protein n=1 Tax=Nitrosomonas ureae TaxID=44577 RepID=A0A286AGQ0_9PROT|nr:hypothetical protein SAMN06297164_3150 [Nitrosomonas ureae]
MEGIIYTNLDVNSFHLRTVLSELEQGFKTFFKF